MRQSAPHWLAPLAASSVCCIQLVTCYKQLKADGGVLYVRPLEGFVKETFELLMLDKLIPNDPS